MIDELESRLRKLSRSVVLRPEDERAIENVNAPRISAPRSRPAPLAVRISATAAAAIVAILLANVAAAYFAPKYQRTLADSGAGPVSQRFLAAVGLSDGDVATIGDSATSSGHTLQLEAGYADGLRTVLFLSIDGRGVTGNPKQFGPNPGDWSVNYDETTLTDQFGNNYGAAGIGGPTDLQFEALKWPASEVGGRLTLRITGIWAMWKGLAQGPNNVIDSEALTTHGDWTLHATLIAAPAHAIALPAPVHVSHIDYTFTSITASETEIVLHWTVSGPVNDGLRSAPTPQNPPTAAYTQTMQDYFTPRVFDESGGELQIEEWGFTWPKSGPALGEMTVFIKGPGRYRIQLGGALATPDLQRWVVVP
jgi:hypothetical protein